MAPRRIDVAHLILAVLLCVPDTAIGGWLYSTRNERLSPSDQIVIIYNPHAEAGAMSFADALSHLAGAGKVNRLVMVTLHDLVGTVDFQAEILAGLQTTAPGHLAAAMRSSGRSDHPSMQRLRQPLAQVVLGTATVRALQADLSPHGLRVATVELEKLALIDDGGQRRIACFLWLVLTPS